MNPVIVQLPFRFHFRCNMSILVIVLIIYYYINFSEYLGDLVKNLAELHLVQQTSSDFNSDAYQFNSTTNSAY